MSVARSKPFTVFLVEFCQSTRALLYGKVGQNDAKAMEDVTGIFNETVKSAPKQNTQMPKLDLWLELYISDRVVISGVITNHPKYPNGVRILTSSIEGYSSDKLGKVYAMTKNSKYTLGKRLEGLGEEQIMQLQESAELVSTDCKQTIC